MNKLKYFLLLLLICFGIALSFSAAQEPVEILVGKYPPFQDITGNNLWCELISAAFQKEGVQVKFSWEPILREMGAVSNGQSVAFLNSTLMISPDQRSLFRINPDPFYFLDVGALYSSAKFPAGLGLKSPNDLQGRSIGVIRGSGSVDVFAKAGIPVDITADVESLIKKLCDGRNDVAIIADLTGYEALNNYSPSTKSQYRYESLYQSPMDLIFSMKHPDAAMLQKKFLSGMAKIKADGTYMSILKSYYPAGQVNKNVLPKDMRN